VLPGLRSITVLLCVVGAVTLWTAAADAHAPTARAAAKTVKCGIGSGREFGYTYLTSLSVTNTSCSTGTALAKRHGKESGWRCTTKRLATSPVQYQSRETCTDGSRQIVWAFSQNT
jgi:hypothetical protein